MNFNEKNISMYLDPVSRVNHHYALLKKGFELKILTNKVHQWFNSTPLTTKIHCSFFY